jgi:glycosyltransferase involved in cell wall biosynthesis
MRFHLISLPHTQTTDEYAACAFTEKVRKFCIMMMNLGHEVFLYAGEHNDAPCTEHIQCISEAERSATLDGKHFTTASFDYSLPYWIKFNQNVIDAIRVRHQERDFILSIAGLANKAVSDAFPHPQYQFVEFGIGYGGSFARYRVFESYAWMHLTYGAQGPHNNPNAVDGVWFDAVIPGYFEIERFPFGHADEREDYYLYIGRLTNRKGYDIAEEVCKHIGKKLIIAGVGDMPTYGYYIGTVGPMQRGELMRKARAVFVPTKYIEPFGNVAVEAMGCGTPVICTDWGAMTETVIDGVTGYRCRSFQEFVDATENVKMLDHKRIRQHAIKNYSLPVIALKYQAYFQRLHTLWGEGWYALREPIKLEAA